MKAKLFLVLVFLAINPFYSFAGLPLQPTQAYLSYIKNIQIYVVVISIFLLTISNLSIVHLISLKRKWKSSSVINLFIAIYLAISGLLLHIFIYFFVIPNTSSIFNIYEAPVFILYLPILFLNPLVWLIFGISIFINRIVLKKVMNRSTLIDEFICSIIQLPIIGMVIIYFISKVILATFPFSGVKFTGF